VGVLAIVLALPIAWAAKIACGIAWTIGVAFIEHRFLSRYVGRVVELLQR